MRFFLSLCILILMIQNRGVSQDADSSQSFLDNVKILENHKGDLEIGYIYGIPDVISNGNNLHNYRLRGSLGVDVFQMPLVAEAGYVSTSTITGMNSYVSLRLDTDELKRRKELLKSGIRDSLLGKKSKIESEIQELEGKLTFAKEKISSAENHSFEYDRDYLLNSYKLDEEIRLGEVSSDTLITDSLPNTEIIYEQDSLISTSQYMEVYESTLSSGDSLVSGRKEEFENEKDKWVAKYEELQNRIDEAKELVNLYEAQVAVLDEYGELFNVNDLEPKTRLHDFFNGLISNSTVMNIGLAKPMNSNYLLRGLPLLGIHYESEPEPYYFSVTAGRLYNPRTRGYTGLGQTGDVLQWIGAPREAVQYNVAQLKGGVGSINDTHLHFGWLTAKSSNLEIAEKHNVFEIDNYVRTKIFRLKLGAGLSGRDRISDLDDTAAESDDFMSRMAAKGRLVVPIRMTRTQVLLESDYSGPNFYSPGLGFQRPGMFTYRAELEQKIGKKTRLTGFYAREVDGKLRDELTYNVFTHWGVRLEQRIGRSIEIFGEYAPIEQQLEVNRSFDGLDDDMEVFFNDSLGVTQNVDGSFSLQGGFIWTKRVEDTHFSFHSIYQFYRMANYNITNEYHFASIMVFVSIEDLLEIGLSGTYLNNGQSLGSIDNRQTLEAKLGFNATEKFSLEGTYRLVNETDLMSHGYGVNGEYKIREGISFILGLTKVNDDFYFREFIQPNTGIGTPLRAECSFKYTLE